MTQLFQFQFQGNLPAGDIFEHSLWWTADDGTTVTDAGHAADAYLTALMTTAGGIQNSYTTGTIWGFPRVAKVNIADGSTLDSGTGTVSQAGLGTVNNSMPGEVAVCITCRTITDTATTRGRFYLPAPVVTAVVFTGLMTPAVQTAMLVSVKAADLAVRAAGHGFQPVIYSRKNRSTATIVQYECGNVYDAQRRRRNKVTETRSVVTVP